MEVRHHRRQVHKHAAWLGAATLAVAIGLGILFVWAPAFVSVAARNLVNPGVQIEPTNHGFAQIHSNDDKLPSPTSSNVSAANDAGQALQMQLLLESSK